jgi:hypothetical protein
MKIQAASQRPRLASDRPAIPFASPRVPWLPQALEVNSLENRLKNFADEFLDYGAIGGRHVELTIDPHAQRIIICLAERRPTMGSGTVSFQNWTPEEGFTLLKDIRVQVLP